MSFVPRVLIGLGVFFIVLGLTWHFLGQVFQNLHLGRLPGDIAIEKKNFRFYFPITTSILISVVLTIIFYVISLFRK